MWNDHHFGFCGTFFLEKLMFLKFAECLQCAPRKSQELDPICCNLLWCHLNGKEQTNAIADANASRTNDDANKFSNGLLQCNLN